MKLEIKARPKEVLLTLGTCNAILTTRETHQLRAALQAAVWKAESYNAFEPFLNIEVGLDKEPF